VLLVSHEGSAQIVDARPAGRFNGQVAEPRPGLRRGHIPGALNVPWTDLVINGELKTADELNEIFARQGVDFERPIIASCGSGVTAAVVVLALPRSALTALPVRRLMERMGRADGFAD
jgi:thiosulfate/3-mercaptopyruvate sulfurtransferase